MNISHLINKYITLPLLCLSALGTTAQAHLFPTVTRIIYHGDDQFTTVNVNNSDKDNYYGLESWTEAAQANNPSQSLSNTMNHTFMVSPKFTTVAPEKEASLRIIKLPNLKLPQDRESLFYLYFQEAPPKLDMTKFIPSAKSSTVSALQIVLSAKIKLIYRPKEIASLSTDTLKGKLSIQKTVDGVLISNDSPYVINTLEILSNKRKIIDQPTIFLPFTVTYVKHHLTKQLSAPLTMHYLDDYGFTKNTMLKINNQKPLSVKHTDKAYQIIKQLK